MSCFSSFNYFSQIEAQSFVTNLMNEEEAVGAVSAIPAYSFDRDHDDNEFVNRIDGEGSNHDDDAHDTDDYEVDREDDDNDDADDEMLSSALPAKRSTSKRFDSLLFILSRNSSNLIFYMILFGYHLMQKQIKSQIDYFPMAQRMIMNIGLISVVLRNACSTEVIYACASRSALVKGSKVILGSGEE